MYIRVFLAASGRQWGSGGADNGGGVRNNFAEKPSLLWV